MLFKKLSARWADTICQTAGETDSYKIALTGYVFELALSFCLSSTVLFILAWSLGILKTALLIGLSGAVIKSFTGGPHMSTPLGCALLGAVSLTAISYLAIFFPIAVMPMGMLILILALVNLIVWLKAPREVQGKPLTDEQKKMLALFSKIIICFIALGCLLWPKVWGVNELFYGMVFQVLYLINFAEQGMEKIDHLYRKVERTAIF